MKCILIILSVLTSLSSTAMASQFRDGSVENNYIHGFAKHSSNGKQDQMSGVHVRRTFFGDGSIENNYIAGNVNKNEKTTNAVIPSDGSNFFGDGSPNN